MLPVTALTGLNEVQLSSVIAHELAHIKRFDSLVNLFQIGVETLLFYHPAVWWLNKRIREERENCCDDMAVEVCGNPLTYAHALARLAESQTAPRLMMAANGRPLAAWWRVCWESGINRKEFAEQSFRWDCCASPLRCSPVLRSSASRETFMPSRPLAQSHSSLQLQLTLRQPFPSLRRMHFPLFRFMFRPLRR
jgi:Zn-dependent protease with chaperone function